MWTDVVRLRKELLIAACRRILWPPGGLCTRPAPHDSRWCATLLDLNPKVTTAAPLSDTDDDRRKSTLISRKHSFLTNNKFPPTLPMQLHYQYDDYTVSTSPIIVFVRRKIRSVPCNIWEGNFRRCFSKVMDQWTSVFFIFYVPYIHQQFDINTVSRVYPFCMDPYNFLIILKN